MADDERPRLGPRGDRPGDHERDFARILAYVSGEGTADERRALAAWIEAEPARRALAEELRTYRSARAATPTWDTERALRTLLDEFHARRPAPAPSGASSAATPRSRRVRTLSLLPATAQRPRWRAASWAAAAAVLVAVGSTLVWRLETRPASPERSAAARDSAANAREFATARAQRAEIWLSDGTRVVLAPASRLRVPQDYAAAAREVALEGEAYFVVRPDRAHPFRVRTARSITEDVSTEFGVRAYAGDTAVRVVVAEGKVALRATASRPPSPRGGERVVADTALPPAIELTARQIAVLSPSGIAVRRVRDLAPYLGWARGRLVFRDAPLRDVAVELGRWYALDIRLSEPALGERRLTSSFGDEPLSEVLRSLEVTLDVRAARGGDVVRLSPSRRGVPR